MAIPSESIGSIPRPPSLIEAARRFRSGRISQAELLSQYDPAVQDTIARFEATGSKVVTDGEQALCHLSHSVSDEHCRGRNSDSIRGWQARVASRYNVGGRSSSDSKLEIGR
jgi:hypothetical protein